MIFFLYISRKINVGVISKDVKIIFLLLIKLSGEGGFRCVANWIR